MLTIIVINSGVGLAYGAMPALIMSSVPLSETAAANGFNTLMRSLGTSVGAAVIGVVLAQMTTTMGGHTFTSEGGFRTGLLIGCGVALVAVADRGRHPGRAPRRGPTPRRPRRATRSPSRRGPRSERAILFRLCCASSAVQNRSPSVAREKASPRRASRSVSYRPSAVASTSKPCATTGG